MGLLCRLIRVFVVRVLQRTRESWQIVFFITAGIYALGGTVFLVLASGTIQPWGIDKSESTMELVVTAEQLPESAAREWTDIMLPKKAKTL